MEQSCVRPGNGARGTSHLVRCGSGSPQHHCPEPCAHHHTLLQCQPPRHSDGIVGADLQAAQQVAAGRHFRGLTSGRTEASRRLRYAAAATLQCPCDAGSHEQPCRLCTIRLPAATLACLHDAVQQRRVQVLGHKAGADALQGEARAVVSGG